LISNNTTNQTTSDVPDDEYVPTSSASRLIGNSARLCLLFTVLFGWRV
jgi:hypothetical protein